MRLILNIRKPGMLTTVQDLGRWGYQALGVPVAGAVDRGALRLGNLLCGNPENLAGLEIALLGPAIEFEGRGLIALAGADLGARLNGRDVPRWSVLLVRDGDVLDFGGFRQRGCYAYLAAAGGFDLPEVMGSRSTYLRGGFGGYRGRALKAGDRLVGGEPAGDWPRLADFVCPAILAGETDPGQPIPVLPGPQEDVLDPAALDLLFSATFKVTRQTDRMGCRLEGPALSHRGKVDIVSDAAPAGAIQIPGDGAPIVLLADRQTTGGYPKPGVVAGAALGALAQRHPGQEVRFTRVTREEAVALLRRERDRLDRLCEILSGYRSAQS